MKKILIYSSSLCSYCKAAKNLLKQENLKFKEISVDNKPEIREEMVKKSSGKKTVPQIFFDEYHVGGFDELNNVYKNGSLLKKLDER